MALVGWRNTLWHGTYVWPSYSKIGSQPIVFSISSYTQWKQKKEYQNTPKFVGPLAGTILPCWVSVVIEDMDLERGIHLYVLGI